MKVCFISLKAYPLFKSDVKAMHGGAEVQMSILAKHLAENNDFDVHVITANYKNSGKEKIQNITLWPSFHFLLFTFFKIIRFLKVFNKVNADIYIQRTLTLYSFFLAKYCRLKKKKFIYMVAHDNELNGKEKLFRYPFGRYLIKGMYKNATAVVVQNNYQKTLIKTHFDISQPYVMKKIAEIHEHGGIFDFYGKYDGVWLARAETWKQPEKFIELAILNPSKKFIMICPELSRSMSGRQYNKLMKKVYKQTNITFVTHLPYSQVFSILRKCKVFFSTSASEGDLPMSLLEGAVVGLPVLILSINNYREEGQDVGIYCNNNVETMNEWFNKLLNDSELYNKHSIAAKEYVNKYHNREKIIPAFETILNEVIAH